MLPIVVLISGNGSNLQAIIDQIAQKTLNAEIKAVLSSTPDAYGLVRAKKGNIPTEVYSWKLEKQRDHSLTREAYDDILAKKVQRYTPQLIVLAGWMHILSPHFLDYFPQQVINLHPSLLPSFPGSHAIEQAFSYGVKYTGCTVHIVDSGVDTGPIILQTPVKIEEFDTLASLSERIHAQEHIALTKAIDLFINKKITINGRKVTLQD